MSAGPGAGASAEQPLCRLDQLQQGQSRGLMRQGNDDRVFAVRRGETVHVYLNWCPHNGRPLEYQRDRFLSGTGDRIVCYAHGAHFDIESGHCFYGPCAGQSLVKVPARVVAGVVVVPAALPAGPVQRANRS